MFEIKLNIHYIRAMSPKGHIHSDSVHTCCLTMAMGHPTCNIRYSVIDRLIIYFTPHRLYNRLRAQKYFVHQLIGS